MLIIPAIDIKDGKVVRLTKGDFLKVEVYSDDAAGTAAGWQDAGAELLHVVDLDGARSGELKNLGVIEKIIKKVKMPVEVGGGIRDEGVIEDLLSMGASFVVLGTKALDEGFLAGALKKFKEKLVVSVDSRDGTVAVKGWQESGNTDAVRFAKDLEAAGMRRIVYTDIAKDGTLKGPNFFNIEKILDATNIEVIASGGIGTIDDIRRLKIYEKKGLTGVIVGKALYEGKVDLKAAIQELS